VGLSFSQKREGKSAKGVNIRYYLSSKDMNAKEFVHAIRSHWRIENSLHWLLDVGFKAGMKRKRKKVALSTYYIEVELAACAERGF